MASQICGQCGASVAADEQFCPQCGSFIDPLTPGSVVTPPPTGRPGTRPGNVISISSDGNNTSKYEEFSLQEPPAEAKPPPTQPPRKTNGDTIECPSCQATNPAGNRHCQQCGARLQQGALPTAPRPAVQSTAGVRAAVAISALFLVVVLAAVIFNFARGGDNGANGTTTSTGQITTTAQSSTPNAPLTVLSETCDPQGIGTLQCSNLTDGSNTTEYQINWEALSTVPDAKVTITLSFEVAMTIDRIEWVNIIDETRFRQNHKARGVSFVADNALIPVPAEIQNQAGGHFISFAAVGAHRITIEVVSTWLPEVVDNQTFRELAIAEIVVWGRPTANGS